MSSDRVLSAEERLAVAKDIFSRTSRNSRYLWQSDTYNSSIMNGFTGILVFAAAAKKFIGENDLFEELMVETEAAVEGFRFKRTSFSVGAAGLLFALERVKEITGDSRCGSMADNLLLYLLLYDYSVSDSDYINGNAGILKVLCMFDELFSFPGVNMLAGELADRILKNIAVNENGEKVLKNTFFNSVLSGMGHGQCGIASALFDAGKKLGRDDCIDASLSLYRFEQSVYDKTAKAWPDYRPESKGGIFRMNGYCSGAPGIGFDMVSKYERNFREPIFDELLSDALEACLAREELARDHLCCGNCSSVDFLLEAGRVLNREDYTQAAIVKLSEMYRRSIEKGDFTVILTDDCVFALYYGFPGIGYEFIRSVFPREVKTCLL